MKLSELSKNKIVYVRGFAKTIKGPVIYECIVKSWTHIHAELQCTDGSGTFERPIRELMERLPANAKTTSEAGIYQEQEPHKVITKEYKQARQVFGATNK